MCRAVTRAATIPATTTTITTVGIGGVIAATGITIGMVIADVITDGMAVIAAGTTGGMAVTAAGTTDGAAIAAGVMTVGAADAIADMTDIAGTIAVVTESGEQTCKAGFAAGLSYLRSR